MSASLAKGKGEEPWVQPIVVAKTGSHEETIRLGAMASVAVRLTRPQREQDEQAFQAWLAGAFTKTVRRADAKTMGKLQAWAQEIGMPLASTAAGASAALALPPMKYEDFPKLLARLQVSGTEFAPSTDEPALDELAPVRLLVLDSLTTGKAVAQAAHGLWKWILETPEDSVRAWVNDGMPAHISLATQCDLAHISEDSDWLVVRDNGLTEVRSSTLTTLARLSR